MERESKFMRLLAIVQTVCGWFLSVSMTTLAIILAFSFPLQACLFGLIAIGTCPAVDLPHIVRVAVAVVGFVALSV